MATDEGAGSGSVLLAFLVGAVAGAALALLYAPATGRETRELLGDKSREGRDKAAALAEKGRQVINEGREKAAALAEKGKRAINDGGDLDDGHRTRPWPAGTEARAKTREAWSLVFLRRNRAATLTAAIGASQGVDCRPDAWRHSRLHLVSAAEHELTPAFEPYPMRSAAMPRARSRGNDRSRRVRSALAAPGATSRKKS